MDHIENTISWSLFTGRFVAIARVFTGRCLTTTASSCSIILAFSHYVTLLLRYKVIFLA
jgi:hypothetical protein